MTTRFLPACLLLLLHAFATPFHAADDLDHVSFIGVVTDAAGGLLPGARVSVRNETTGQGRLLITKQDGAYRFTALAPGLYELRVELQGFQTLRYTGLNAVAGATVRRDFQLQPAAVEAQVTIDAAVNQPLVDTARTVVGGTITQQQIETLPTEGRNPFNLIYLLPGVAPPAFDEQNLAEGDRQDRFRRAPEEVGLFGLSGGAGFSNNLTIEGFDNNDDRAARERFTPSIDAVAEVQVITNQFSAEYGRASGGRINLRLRGGGNQYRGRAYYYFRDESLNANSFRRNADPERGFRLPYQNHNPGLNFGGPIFKKRLFFFSSFEHDYVYDRADIAALLPVGANSLFALPKANGANLGNTAVDRTGKRIIVNGGAEVGLYDEQITTPRVADTLQARSDWHWRDGHTLFGVFTFARNRDERGFPGGRRTLETLRRTGRDSQSFALADNSVLAPQLVNDARFQFSRLTPADAPASTKPVVLIDIDDPRDVGGNANANPLTRTGTLLAGSSTISGTDRREDRYQFQDTLSYISGAHTWRVGGDVQIIRSRFVDLEDATGTFTFASPADFLANKPARYLHRFNTESALRNNYVGLFVQDDWRVRPNLVLGFGLRWDNETILKDRNNFGPRLSVAWDPFKDGKTVVRAGYGTFFSRALLRTLDDYVLTSGALAVDTNNDAAQRLLTELQFPRVLAANDPRVGQLGVREAGFQRRLSNDFRIPESYQASLGVERELSKGFKVEVNYIYHRGIHLWREINANAARLPAGFKDFTAYLTSREFDNRRDAAGQRPISTVGNADVVRFDLGATASRTAQESGRSIVTFGLNNQSTSNSSSVIRAALAALRPLRPNQQLTQVEELQAVGNSFYHGASFEVQRRFSARASLRGSYTLSQLIDDGVVNTSSPLVVGDFRRERSRSLLDARHRFAFSGHYQFPAWLGGVKLASTFNYHSSRPFNLGANGNDRNLDDVNTDRPNFDGDLNAIVWRRSGETLNRALTEAFTLPTVGTVGNLPRNAGRGPHGYTLSARLSRGFRLDEHRRVELQAEAFNPLNNTILNFGAEFADFIPSSLGNFLIPPRAFRPRTMRLGLRFDF